MSELSSCPLPPLHSPSAPTTHCCCCCCLWHAHNYSSLCHLCKFSLRFCLQLPTICTGARCKNWNKWQCCPLSYPPLPLFTVSLSACNCCKCWQHVAMTMTRLPCSSARGAAAVAVCCRRHSVGHVYHNAHQMLKWHNTTNTNNNNNNVDYNNINVWQCTVR